MRYTLHFTLHIPINILYVFYRNFTIYETVQDINKKYSQDQRYFKYNPKLKSRVRLYHSYNVHETHHG
jgi:hypothetical protein